MKFLLNNEPAITLAQSIGLLTASFGLNLIDGNVGTILAIVSAVLGIITRSRVTPVRKLGNEQKLGSKILDDSYDLRE